MIAPGLSLFVALATMAQAGDPPLDRRLLDEDPAALASAARTQGDPARGAVVFYQPQLACARCHVAGPVGATLGPDLARIGAEVTDAHLIESILEPSKVVRKGYETVAIEADDGRVVSGLVAEDRPDAVVLRDPATGGEPRTIPRASIVATKTSPTSLMPPGLVNGLATRRQFLDLVAYLRAIADGGPARALALRPAPGLLLPAVADYERDLDHAGLIADLDREALLRGAATYARVCANCHGTADREGSMPTSLRFASGTFRNGSDPLSMYRTLTHGFGQMPAQPWMVPTQKYDVIHYIRETFLKDRNPSQYRRVDAAYLASLPKGGSRGPAAVDRRPWSEMDYGPSLMATYEVGEAGANFAMKGIAVRLDPGPGGIAAGRRFAAYDHDTLRLAALWDGPGFIDWHGINFDGRHETHPRIVGTRRLVNPPGPGWADPATGRFDDPRPLGRDGRPYGPLPRTWARYRGIYRHGDRVVLAYTIGKADVLDMTAADGPDVIARTLEVGASPVDLLMRVAPEAVPVALVGGGELVRRDGLTLLRIPAASTPARLKILIAADRATLDQRAATSTPPAPLALLTRGGPTQWPETLTTDPIVGRSDGPFAVDTLTHPESTPWKSQFRLSGLDFLPDGKGLIVCDWDGDVWRVDGIDRPRGPLRWRRIASGLFQPLGLKIVDGNIYVGCRDQIAILHDLNGDGEADFIACFNDDHQVTEHFHEFAMDLQVDPAGDFYYAKGARHGKTAVVPQHGTLLRVSKDGSRTEILARGFRAPNGVCLNPDGTFVLTDQEGHWIPKNRINWVKPGGFYGNMWAYHDVTDPSDAAMEAPLCWITNAMDRSPSEIIRVASPAWGPLDGSLLGLSYGSGKVFAVPYERVAGRMQGGVVALPIPPAPTGLIRGRFHPGDGGLYACGMFAWAGDRQQPGGLYRLRVTGRPMHLPVGLSARRDGMALTFTDPLDPASATARSNYKVKVWSLRRSAKYGSEHVAEHAIDVASARLSPDRRTVILALPAIAPTPSMEIRYTVRASDGSPVEGTIHNTIHALND